MDKLALILSIAALAVGGFAAFGGTDGAGLTGSEDMSLDARVAALETEIDALKARDGDVLIAVDGSTSANGAGLEGRPDVPLPSRIASLESELASMRERVTAVETKSDDAMDFGKAGGRVRRMMNNRFFPTVDAAATALKLDDTQKSDLDQIVQSTKDRLEDLYAIENDDGMTWKEAGKLEIQGDAGSGSVVSFFGNMAKLEKFKKTVVPGTSETFGEASQRIRGQGKAEARDMLSPTQQETWDQAHTDPLFGSGGGGAAISFVSSSFASSDKDK